LPTNILHAFLFSPFVPHALPISSSTWSFIQRPLIYMRTIKLMPYQLYMTHRNL
jgi:hypothetical protein